MKKFKLFKALMLLFSIMLISPQMWAVNSTFTKGETIFFYSEGTSSAWRDGACVKADFSNNGSSTTQVTTAWLCNATDNENYKVFWAIVPSTGKNRVHLHRYASNCSTDWTQDGNDINQSNRSKDSYNVIYSTAYNNSGWKNETFSFGLKTDVNTWGDPVATFVDKGDGLFQCTYTFTATATSQKFKVLDCWSHWYGQKSDGGDYVLKGLSKGNAYTVIASFYIQDCDANNGKTSLSVMVVHKPGVYVATTGDGYSQTLTTWAGGKYEVYASTKSSSHNYVWGGATSSSTSDKRCVGDFSSGSEVASKWMHGLVTGNSSGSFTADKEHPACSNKMTFKNNSGTIGYLEFCVTGYDSLTIRAKDGGSKKADNKYLKVIINGTDVAEFSNTLTIRRYKLTPSQNTIIRLEGQSSTASELYSIALRPSKPTITASSLSGATYYQGDASTNLSVTASPVVTGATLTYQWYSNTTASNSGGTEVDGATSATFAPPTTSIGTTYYYCVISESGCNTTTSSVSGAITVNAAVCAAPTGLSAGSLTAKGATLTVTDGEDTNDYEFYVATASTAPTAESTKTHSVTSSKSLTITNLVAGTTYYAWARTKCSASNKSDWVALGFSTFTTSTVSADYHLTNVTKSSGATSGIGGSTFTAVFAAASGYSLPSPVVTIGGNAATSGTHYTWNAGTGTLTINADKINGNIDITMNSAATAPTNVAISGTYHYYPGETISLTATATGGNGPKTYQWYHGGTADGDAIEGATSATYSKASCVVGDAGSYYCKVTCGGSASRWSDGATQKTAFNVKIMQFHLKNSGGSTISTHALTKVDATHATLPLSLTGGTTYKFRVTDGCGNWYGNNGEMTSSNCTNWAMDADNDCRVTTSSKSATYTFNFDFSGGLLGTEMRVSVVYPAGDQAAGKVIYWDNNVLNWASAPWYRIGKGTHNNKTQMTLVPGTAKLYKVTTAEYNGFEYWHIANNEGEGTGNIFWTKDSDPTTNEAITEAMGFEGSPVTADAITVTPTAGSHGTGTSSDNDNCEFYEYGQQNGMKTDRVTISDYSGGTITVNYTNTSGSAATLTSGNADLAHSVILTSITAVADEGYDASAITINDGDYSANYVVTGNTTIAASFTPHVYTITLNKGEHGAANQSATVAYLADELTSITHVSSTGYTLTGYYDGSTKVLNANGTFAGDDITGYITDGKWSKTTDATLTAKWEAQTYTISYKDKGNKTYSGSNLASLPTSHTYGSSTALVDGVKSGYTFVGWFTDEDCTVSAGSSIGATAKTANFTLYAKWTYSCPADNSGETIYKFVPVTSSSENIADATDFTTENYLSELTGGTLVSHCSASGNVKMNSNGVQLASSTGYLELNFECALQTGDKVKWKCYSAAVRLCNSTTYDSSKDLVLAKSQDSYSELYITSSMEGKKKLYLMHSGSNSTVMTFELYRAGGYNVTYKANGSGESDVAHVTATVEDNMFTRNGYTFTGWNTDDEGEGDAYSAGDDVTEDLTLYAQWTCTTPTFGTNLSTTPHEVEQGDAAVTLTVAATANSGTVTYQWYSNTSKSTVGATTLTTGASYNAPTSPVGTLYYYCVATNSTSGCSTTAQSNYATVTVSEAPCFKFVAGTTKAGSGWDVANNGSITTSLWSAGDPVLTGGTMTNTSGSTISAKNKSSDTHYGLVYAADGKKQVTVTLSGSHVLAKDAVITINGFSNNTTTACGFKISGNDMSPATYTPGSAAYTAFTQTYKVTAGSALEGASSFTVDQATSVRVYLKSISVTGCEECTPITPTLTAGTTTLYSYPAPTSTTLTLDKKSSTGGVIWSSSNEEIATVSGSGTTATVTAVASGTATITASIAADGTYCAKSVSKTFTVTGGCGSTVIAGVTATSGTAGTPEGTLIASSSGYGVSLGSNTKDKANVDGYKIDGSKYMYLTLSEGNYFKSGDEVLVYIAVLSDIGTNPGIYIYTGTTVGSGTLVGSKLNANLTANTSTASENSIILSNVPANTSSIIIPRTTDQNAYIKAMKVKRYVCPEGVFEFNDASSDGKWSTAGNWIDDEGVAESLPTISDRVIISKPVTVDDDDAVASEVILDQKSPNTGKLTIDAGNALIIAGTLKKTTTGTSVVATAAADVIINSTRAVGTGALVMGSHDGTNAATVNFETKVKYDNGYVNQYLGSPFSDETPYVDYEIQLYKFVPQGNGSHGWWNKLSYGDEMVPFMGYNQLSNNTSGSYLDLDGRTGHLNASSNVEFTIANGKMYYNSSWPENMFANSWTAPIHIDQFEDGDFTNVKKVIYIFNAGTPAQYNEAYGGENSLGNDSGDEDNEAAGTYTVIPVKSAAELSALGAVTTVIPAMQAFSVMATSSSPSLTLNFNRLVYTPATTGLKIEPTRAPKRNEERPDAMRLRVRGLNGWTANAYILGREDFTEGYDDGWDGEYMEGDGSAPQLYSATEAGYFVVNCVPEIEGTLMAFHPGSADNAYTFSFVYKGTETWYLNDLKEQQSTLISNETSYPFVSVAGDKAARFVISKTPINKIVTGIDETNGEKDAKVRKLLIDDHIYIIRGGKMYTADGALVK